MVAAPSPGFFLGYREADAARTAGLVSDGPPGAASAARSDRPAARRTCGSERGFEVSVNARVRGRARVVLLRRRSVGGAPRSWWGSRVIFKLFICRCAARFGPRRAPAHLVVGQVPERRARLQGCAGNGMEVSASALQRSGVRGTPSAHAPFEARGIRTFCLGVGRVFSRCLKPRRTLSHRALRASRADAVARIVRPIDAVGGRSEARAARRVRARATVRAVVGTSPGESQSLCENQTRVPWCEDEISKSKLRVEILKCDGLFMV